MTGSFTTTLSYEEYLAANRLMVRRRWYRRGILRFVLILWAAYAVLGAGVVIIDDGSFDGAMILDVLAVSFGISVAIAALVSLINLWKLPRSARKMWAQQHIEGLPTVHDYDETGIRIANDRGSSNFTWTMLSGWIEDENLLMMFRTAMMFHAIPKAQVSKAELDRLRQLLIASGVPPRC